MTLDPLQAEKAKTLLERIFTDPSCRTGCGCKKYSFDGIYGTPTLRDSYSGESEGILPCLTVTCENCGYVIVFNAIKMGVINGKEELKCQKWYKKLMSKITRRWISTKK